MRCVARGLQTVGDAVYEVRFREVERFDCDRNAVPGRNAAAQAQGVQELTVGHVWVEALRDVA